MTSRAPRLRPSVLCLITLALCLPLIVSAQESQRTPEPGEQAVLGHFTIPDTSTAEDTLARDKTPGALEYERAQALIENLSAPVHRAARLSKPSGSLSLVWYYLRKLAVFLFVNGPQTVSHSSRKLSPQITEAIELLEISAAAGNADAAYSLADLNFYGKYGHPRNYSRAFQGYQEIASLHGHAAAQHMLGFMYSTGIGGVVQKDQAKALLHHSFAADAGDTRAEMTLAFRYHAGIGTLRDCERSVSYYKRVADKAIRHVQSGPPGGRRLLKESYRLADEEGGVYGEGASYSSAGPYARHGPAPDADQTLDDYLEYLDLMSRKGDLKATFRLGQYYYEGSRALKQDFVTAKEFFQDIARRYWSTKDGRIRPDVDRELEKLASKAAGYLGSMFLRGEGVEQNFAKAKIWFRRGVENGDSLCQYSLGLMHLLGLGMPEDAIKASEYLGAAADQDLAVAQVRLGALHLDQGDIPTANKYFDLAARPAHSNIESFYYLAELTNLGVGRDRSCGTAALYYKLVAERAESLHSNFADANDLYELGDREAALTLYMQAAEQGYEAAQANVAYILDGTARVYPTLLHSLFPSLFRFTSSRLSEASLALTYWTRSAKQANVDSLVKMGDYYLSGLGTAPPANETAQAAPRAPSGAPDPDKAAACYAAAAETQMSAQALWNLGWMHENGLGGMTCDFHLAKRYYDSALETNAEAYLPVTLALFKLRARSWWNGITGGKAKGINAGDSARRRSFAEWLTEFLIAEAGDIDAQQLHLHHQQQQQQHQVAGIDGDGGGGGGGGEYDAGYAGEEALYDDYDPEGESLWEAALFALLAAGLAILVWYRQTFRQRQQNDDGGDGNAAAPGQGARGDGAQAPPQDRGLFPARNEPEFANWVAGGVGH